MWGWDQVKGLVQIIDGNCSTGVTPQNPGIEVEDMSWNNAGDTIYFAYNNHNGADPDGSDAKATHHIGSASAAGSVDWNVCDIQAGEIEAIEVLNDGTLLVGSHQNGRQLTTVFDLQACQAIGGGETAAYDIEGLAACLPEIASCPSTSIAGTWTMGLDTDCDGRANIISTANYRDNLTWNVSRFTNRGSWSQQGCDMGMIDVSVSPQAIWTGTMGEDGSLSGTIKFNGRNMCWTANRAG